MRDLVLISTLIGACFVTLLFAIGSADVEESTNSAYSIGAISTATISHADRIPHALGGVPVFDTLQGVGDRLPYQASWAQSVVWPLRFVAPQEYHSLFRALLYLIPATVIGLISLQSWMSALSWRRATLFAFLSNSSLGIFVRQNDWSDHFVQVVGIAAVVLFLMNRVFHDTACIQTEPQKVVSLTCLFVSVNGVLTGHPGLWPTALFVWLSFFTVFGSQRVCRRAIRDWYRGQKIPIFVSLAASATTVAVVSGDLLSELSSKSWSSGRLARSQGLFSEFAFQGVYGFSPGGSLPHGVIRVASSILASTVMPLFVLLDGVLPQMFRASDFREFSRVEFCGATVLLAFLFGFRTLGKSPIRRMISLSAICQALVWLSVIISVLDLFPAALASSGAWMTLTIVLIVNVYLSFLLLGSVPRTSHSVRGVSMGSLALIGYWCFIQFGLAGFGTPLRVPPQYPSRFDAASALAATDWYSSTSLRRDRVLISSTPSFYDFLGFVANGYPVVAPADPKVRASNQLQSNFSFNFSINSPRFEGLSSDQISRTLDFLQVRHVLIGEPTSSEFVPPPAISEGLLSTLTELGPPQGLALPQATYEVYSRDIFSAFILPASVATKTLTCPVLFEACPVITESTQLSTSADPHLRHCFQDCLWTFKTPKIAASDVLLIPVTYDSALTVRDTAGSRLETSNVGGFLGVSGENGLDEGVLTLSLSPDARMLSRVVVSYLNLGVLLFLLGCAASPWVKSRSRKLRVK